MELYVAVDPVQIRTLGVNGIMLQPHRIADLIEQPGALSLTLHAKFLPCHRGLLTSVIGPTWLKIIYNVLSSLETLGNMGWNEPLTLSLSFPSKWARRKSGHKDHANLQPWRSTSSISSIGSIPTFAKSGLGTALAYQNAIAVRF